MIRKMPKKDQNQISDTVNLPKSLCIELSLTIINELKKFMSFRDISDALNKIVSRGELSLIKSRRHFPSGEKGQKFIEKLFKLKTLKEENQSGKKED